MRRTGRANAQFELVAYAGRVVDESEPRYKVPAGFQKSLELFNLHHVTEPEAILVEGFFDCMKVHLHSKCTTKFFAISLARNLHSERLYRWATTDQTTRAM
jgi:hypothetical protein